MHKRTKTLATILAIAAATSVALTGCTAGGGTASASDTSKATVDKKADARAPYLPKNDVEFNNYNKAQELYDDPSSILWCTTSFPTASSPLVTFPIAGKLTSSSTSYYPGHSQKFDSGSAYGYTWSEENRSVDGMFHGNPPAYRYGFTPGGQYVDLFNTPAVCTTALTKFQRESTEVTVNLDNGGASDLQKQAEAALKAGDRAKADQILQGVTK